MWCERPLLDGTAIVSGSVTIEGWAYSALGVEGVYVYVDGRRHRSRLGVFRDDLRELLGESATRCGFYLTVELGDHRSGQLELAVVARGTDGRAVGVRGKLACLGSDGSPAPSPDVAPGSTAIDTDPFGSVERFVPEDAPGSLIEAEHEARYRWAARAVRGRAVLDAGCGVGYGTAIVAGAGAARAVGIDISAEAIEHAHGRYGHAGGFVVGDLEGLPFADDTFDAVVCFEAIEHVADPSCVLDEFRRVLRPEGVLLISSPNRGVYPPGNRFHIHEYRPRELEEALARRFANVRLYQQRSHYTSLISDGSKPSRARSEPNPAPDVQMLPSRSEPEETYVVAVAGDGALPELEPPDNQFRPQNGRSLAQGRRGHDELGRRSF
jgi:SAM-dependent methyltransferase